MMFNCKNTYIHTYIHTYILLQFYLGAPVAAGLPINQGFFILIIISLEFSACLLQVLHSRKEQNHAIEKSPRNTEKIVFPLGFKLRPVRLGAHARLNFYHWATKISSVARTYLYVHHNDIRIVYVYTL